jgi:Na+/H+-dicarboxylate symporter
MVRMDILPLIIFSLLLGGAITTMGASGRPLLALFEAGNEVVMKIVHLLLLFAPVGIFGLLAGRIGKAGGWVEFWPELVMVGKYCLTVISGLFLHAVVILPLILFFFGRRNPLAYARGMAKALLTAFSTASSSGTLPVTMESTIEKNEVSERTSRFVLPLGATINMDGTALYEAVAAIFIAQVYGIHLDFAAQLTVLVTATLAAIGAAGIPEAGLVTMVIVLKAVGLPIEGISLILIVDWFLDRCRTTVNVWGDSIGAGVIDRYERETPAS